MHQRCLSVLADYRYWISPFLGPVCRFEPSCSEYASASISRYGALCRRKLATCRLLKCYPFHPGEMDPVK